MDQRVSQAHTCLGQVNGSKGDYEQAAEDFNHAITFEPTNDDAQRGLGTTLEVWGHWDDAEKAYLKAIEIRSQYWAGYMRLASFYKNRRHDYARYRELLQSIGGITGQRPGLLRVGRRLY